MTCRIGPKNRQSTATKYSAWRYTVPYRSVGCAFLVVTCRRGVQPRCSEHEPTRPENTAVVDRGKSADAALQTLRSPPPPSSTCTGGAPHSAPCREEGEDGSGQRAEKKSFPPPPAEDCATSGWRGMGGGGGRPPICKCTALVNEVPRSTQLFPLSKLRRCSRRCGGEPTQPVHECAAGPPPASHPSCVLQKSPRQHGLARTSSPGRCLLCVVLSLNCFASAA